MSVELDGVNNILKTDTISEVTSANGITIDGLSIKDSKLVTANSVIEANMSANSVDSDSYVDGSIDTAHIADAQITVGKLATTVFTGATDIGAAIVDADLFLMDDGAGGTIRKTTAARLKTYAGFEPDAAQVFNESSADVDFRIESNGNANMLFLDGGNNRIQIGSATSVAPMDLAGALQLTGNSVNAMSLNRFTADDGGFDLIFLSSRNATPGSNTIVQDNDELGAIHFCADDGGDYATEGAKIFARINGTPGANDIPTELVFSTTADGANSHTERVRIDSAGLFNTLAGASLGGGVVVNEGSGAVNFRVETDDATHMLFVTGNKIGINESTPDAVQGVTINQAANDVGILTFKSSDVAHGITDLAETDTYFKAFKSAAATGGLRLDSYTEASLGIQLTPQVTTVVTTKGTGGSAAAQVNVGQRGAGGGTGVGAVSANANLFGVLADSTLRFVVDQEGDLHYDGGTNATAWDTEEDAHLVRALDLSHGINTIDSKFDKFVGYNHEKLAEMKLVGREEDGTPNHFVNITGLQRLHNGAIWQQYEKHQQLLEAVYELAEKAIGKKEAKAILDKHEVKRLN